jgi:very-short-patch-repair endonuclease
MRKRREGQAHTKAGKGARSKAVQPQAEGSAEAASGITAKEPSLMGHALRMTEEQYSNLQRKRKEPASGVKQADAVPAVHQRRETKASDQYETWLENQLLALGVLGFEREYLWCQGRKFRADLAHLEYRLLVEIDGAVHRIRGRFKSDIEKNQLAILQNWVLLRIAPAQVRNGEACLLVKRVLTMLMAKQVPF